MHHLCHLVRNSLSAPLFCWNDQRSTICFLQSHPSHSLSRCVSRSDWLCQLAPVIRHILPCILVSNKGIIILLNEGMAAQRPPFPPPFKSREQFSEAFVPCTHPLT